MKYLLFALLAMFVSCKKEQKIQVNIDTQIDVFVQSINGDNLLLGGPTNAINPDSIKLSYLINGNVRTVYNSDLDCPRAVCFLTDAGNERIRIFPNDLETEAYPITYIEWGNGDVDTIKCHFERNTSGSTVICDKVWFNSTLKYPDDAIAEIGRAFKIVK